MDQRGGPQGGTGASAVSVLIGAVGVVSILALTLLGVAIANARTIPPATAGGRGIR